jgi:hypothetical protein
MVSDALQSTQYWTAVHVGSGSPTRQMLLGCESGLHTTSCQRVLSPQPCAQPDVVICLHRKKGIQKSPRSEVTR